MNGREGARDKFDEPAILMIGREGAVGQEEGRNKFDEPTVTMLMREGGINLMNPLHRFPMVGGLMIASDVIY